MTRNSAPSDMQRFTSAQRMRWSRERRRKGLRTIPFEIRDSEIDALVSRGYLDAAMGSDRSEIALAPGRFLDRTRALKSVPNSG